MPTPSFLLPIIAHARAGALDHAWRLFAEAGLEGVDEPAALSLKGRLLKDRARAAGGDDRRALYRQAAAAYLRAGELGGGAYPLINAATLSLLAGEAGAAHAHAAAVLAAPEEAAETPYYRAATRAEALLVLGRVAEARAALEAAIARAPRAWEDHASTLRQFALILEALGEDAAWLEPARPPRALHFAGHMALAAGAEAVARRVSEVLTRERIGFGYGALAAGADIVIAEALAAHGAELHLVLPGGEAAFRAASVARYGADWSRRFDRLIAAAESVRAVACGPDPAHPLSLQLGTEVAMGLAVMKAQVLATEAVQLVVLDDADAEDGEPGRSAWSRAAWARSGRRQTVVVAPRDGAAPVSGAPAGGPLRLAAMLSAELEPVPAERLGDEVLPALARLMAEGAAPLTAPRWAGRSLFLAYAAPADAAAAARRISTALGEAVRIGGCYGLASAFGDPFGGGTLLLGEAAEAPARIARSAPPGAIHLSETFAAALHAAVDAARTEYVGDLPGEPPLALHALKG